MQINRLCVAIAALPACAEAVDGAVGVAALPEVGASVDAGGALEGLLVNEVLPTGAEFVELYNAGPAAVDLGGWALASADEQGEPRPKERVELPSLSVKVGGYFVIMGGDEDDAASAGACGLAPEPCIFASVAVSASRGERLLLLGPGGEVLAFDVPAGLVEDGRSWGRLPDGGAALGPLRATPGGPNEAQ